MTAAAVGALPPRPQRRLDVSTIEGLEDLVDPHAPGQAQLKSRDFWELHGLELSPADVRVVLYDANSIDSFAACLAARLALGDRARYEGVDRSTTVADLSVDVTNAVVLMVGLCWTVEALHELVAECDWLLILETYSSVGQELRQFKYPNAQPILEPDMGAAVLAWNFFFPASPVPPLLRAIEDAELGRSALRGSAAFAAGFEAAFQITPPRGQILPENEVLWDLENLLGGGSRPAIQRAIDMGKALQPGIDAQCREAASRRALRTMRHFPAWRCSLVNLSSPFAGLVAEHLASQLVRESAEGAQARCFGAVFEVRRRHVRVVLRSLPGGPDVSEVAALHEGSGRPTRAFFSVPVDEWEAIWVQPEPVLWEVAAAGLHCLALRAGELVTVVRRGERFKESPGDEWSWGYKTNDPAVEGWIPTLAHTLLVATRSVPIFATGVLPLEEGDLIVAEGQRGDFVWGHRLGAGQLPKGWFPYAEGSLQPVHAASAGALLAACGGG